MLSLLLYPNIVPRNRVSRTDVTRVRRLLLLFSFENLLPSYHEKFNTDESDSIDLLRVGLLEGTIFYIINRQSIPSIQTNSFHIVIQIVMCVRVIKSYSILIIN